MNKRFVKKKASAPADAPLGVEVLERSDDAVDLGTAEEALADSAPKDLSFLQKGKMNFRNTIREAANYKELKKTPYGLKPIIIFTSVGAVLSVEGLAFGAAIPEIVKDLDIDVVALFQVTRVIGFVLIFASIGLAYLSDRLPRIPIVGGGIILNGIFALFTAGSSTLPALGAARAGDSIGSTANSVPSSSLIADYYPVNSRGKVFALFGVVGDAVGLMAPAIVLGLVLLTKDGLYWRTPFLITGPLLIIGGLLLILTLKEPVRGYMERKAIGASEEVALTPEEPPSLGEAWRTTWANRTLRRLFIADIPGNVGISIFGFFYSLYLVEEYGLGLDKRIAIGIGLGIATLPFGFLAGGVLDVFNKRRPSQLLVFTGLIGVGSSLALFGLAAGPPLIVLFIFLFLRGALGSLTGPASTVLFINILPAHIRTLGGSVRILAGIPANIISALSVGFVASRYGTQGAMLLGAPFIFLGAVISLSAAPLYERDMRAAMASQLASTEWRRAKAEGRGKLLVSRDIDVEYDGGVQVLFGVDFDVLEGQIIALLGTNGAGKSTLLKAISGIQEASAGAIVFNGRDITHMPAHEIARRGVIHMPGGRGTFPDLSVKENLLLGNWMSSEEAGKQGLKDVYELFPILKQRENARAQQLSGGEQQQLSLAQAFLSRPQLLVIDELSLGLAPVVVQKLVEIVKEINRRGATVIIVEQSVNIALTVAEKCIFMEKGEVKFFGDTKDLLRRPDILRAVYVKGTGALTEGPVSAMRSTEEELRRQGIAEARPVLEVSNVSKSFGGLVAVDDVSLVLREGEALGLIGPNGAGKTTLFDLISGYQIPDSGKILFEGADITNLPADQRAKRRLVRRFQDARLFPSLSVYENILVSLERRLEVRNVALTAMQVPQVRQGEKRVRRRADRLIELLELGAYRDKFVKELSTGLRRITDLACVLAAEPRLLMLDEPSTGIAQAESEGLAPLLRRVRYETGCSMLIIEHDMSLISAISDELIAMVQGGILLRGDPEAILNDDTLIEAYLGTSENVIQRSGVIEDKPDPAARKKKRT